MTRQNHRNFNRVTNHIYSLDVDNGDMIWKSDPINGSIIPPVLTDNDNCVYYSFIEDEKTRLLIR